MTTATEPKQTELSAKGLAPGTVGVLGAVVIGVSTIAPAYTFTAAIGPTVSAVGVQVPAIILLGFVPMLLVAFGYRELNRAMPDAGTSFTWATRAFGPYVGWMAGWGLIIATVLVLSNLAGIAVDFLYLLIAQITGNEAIAEMAANPFINVLTCLAFMAAATWISYRDITTTQRVQYWLVGFQVIVLVAFGATALFRAQSGDAIDHTPIDPSWFNVLQAPSVSSVVAGRSRTIGIVWGWDVVLSRKADAIREEIAFRQKSFEEMSAQLAEAKEKRGSLGASAGRTGARRAISEADDLFSELDRMADKMEGGRARAEAAEAFDELDLEGPSAADFEEIDAPPPDEELDVDAALAELKRRMGRQ